MKKIVKFSILVLILSFIFSCYQERGDSRCSLDRSRFIINSDGQPTQVLLDLLNLVGINCDNHLQDIVKKTQKKWLRKRERWEEVDRYQNRKDQIYPLLERLGCVQEIAPSQKEYDYVIILGALTSTTFSRVEYLIEQFNKKIRFHTIIFLGGQRSLEEREQNILREKKRSDEKLPQNEIEMMRFVCEKEKLTKKMKGVNIVFIDTPMQFSQGSFRRPNTADTIKYWLLQEHLEPRSCLLFVSSQPYVGYQDSVARTIIPNSFDIETVGNRTSSNLNLSVALDNITRWLYQEFLRRESSIDEVSVKLSEYKDMFYY